MTKLFKQKKDMILPLLATMSALALVAAYISQYIFGYQPCILCLYQRWPFFIIIIIYLTSLIAKKQVKTLTTLAILALCANASIAAYHVGVEQKIFLPPSGCSSAINLNKIDNLDELTRAISRINAVKCDEPQFYFLSITMAGWNLLYCLLLIIVSIAIKKDQKLSRRRRR